MRLKLLRPDRVLVLCVLCVVGVHLTAGQTQIAKESSIDSIIEKKMSESGTVGLGAAIIVDKKVVWIKAYGYADKDNKVLFTPNTIINIGSISKTY